MSWINNASTDQSAGPLLTHIADLQHQLQEVNQSLDDKLDQLEDAGLGVVGLTQKLEDAREKIVQLEEEVSRLQRREERRIRRLQRLRCSKCQTKVKFSDLNPTGDDERLISQHSKKKKRCRLTIHAF